MTVGAQGRVYYDLSRDLKEKFARCISWGWGGRSNFREGHIQKSGCLRKATLDLCRLTTTVLCE